MGHSFCLPLKVDEEKEQLEVKIEDVPAKTKEKKPEESKGKQVEQPPIIDTSKYASMLPFPLRQRKMNDDEQRFAKFIETFKKLELKIPFSEALNNMPKYAKFLKDFITNKRKWNENETVPLTETYNSIISRKISIKLKDPRSFIISCTLDSKEFSKCLYDLGASINLMPLSLFRKLNLGEVINIRMIL